jgi:hypothetical protein
MYPVCLVYQTPSVQSMCSAMMYKDFTIRCQARRDLRKKPEGSSGRCNKASVFLPRAPQLTWQQWHHESTSSHSQSNSCMIPVGASGISSTSTIPSSCLCALLVHQSSLCSPMVHDVPLSNQCRQSSAQAHLSSLLAVGASGNHLQNQNGTNMMTEMLVSLVRESR